METDLIEFYYSIGNGKNLWIPELKSLFSVELGKVSFEVKELSVQSMPMMQEEKQLVAKSWNDLCGAEWIFDNNYTRVHSS